MPAWNELINQFKNIPNPIDKEKWFEENVTNCISKISEYRDGRNVIVYGSAFLQKPNVPPWLIQIMKEDINGFMSVMHNMDFSKNLTLILHTPGGDGTAAETIVSYLRTKFNYIEVIIPTYAMSAGTMISLGSDKIIMGRQSQLGPMFLWSCRLINN